MRPIRLFACALLVALTSVFLSAAGAIAQSATPSASTGGVAPTPEPGPPATYYASWGLIALAGLTVIMVLAAYLYHAPGFRQRSGRGAA